MCADATLYCRVTQDGIVVGSVSEGAAYVDDAVVTKEFSCGRASAPLPLYCCYQHLLVVL